MNRNPQNQRLKKVRQVAGKMAKQEIIDRVVVWSMRQESGVCDGSSETDLGAGSAGRQGA
jgi:hypothetical protein